MSGLVVSQVWEVDKTDNLLWVECAYNPRCIQNFVVWVEVDALYKQWAILAWLQRVDSNCWLGWKLDDEDFGAVLGKTDSDVRSLGIGQDFFLSLPLEQKTVRIHVLIHLGTVVGSIVVIE